MFAEKKSHFPDLRPIKKGDIGFLYNMSSDELLGVFVAKDRVKLNVRDDQWWLRTYQLGYLIVPLEVCKGFRMHLKTYLMR